MTNNKKGMIHPETLRILNESIEFYKKQIEGKDRHSALLGLYSVVDSENESASKKLSFSCKKGCAFCCHIKVDAGLTESEVVVQYCKENGIKITEEDKKILSEQSDLSSDEYILSKYKKCIFLSKDNTCKIYTVRPMACRNFFVYSPVSLCEDGYNGKIREIHQYINPYSLGPQMLIAMTERKYESFSKNLLSSL